MIPAARGMTVLLQRVVMILGIKRIAKIVLIENVAMMLVFLTPIRIPAKELIAASIPQPIITVAVALSDSKNI